MPKAKPQNGPLFDPAAFGLAVDDVMAKRRVSPMRAASEMGIWPSALNRVRKGKPPSVETFLRIYLWMEPKSDLFCSLQSLAAHGLRRGIEQSFEEVEEHDQ
jgi:hypothetical protein